MDKSPNITDCETAIIYLVIRQTGDIKMAIKCTVTTDLQAKDTNGYSGMQKHVEHDSKVNHANKDIIFDETQFNIYNESSTVRDELANWNNKKFEAFVNEHDQHQREKNHPERQYGSVKNYLKGKKKTTAVLTIGNMEVQGKLMKQFCPASSYREETLPDGSTHLIFNLKDDKGNPIQDNINVARKFYGCFNRALIAATNNTAGWNRNGKRINIGDYLHRGRYATNNDEMGMSHLHFEVGTFGMTRGGKKRAAHPTNSLNQALVSLHHAVTGEYASGRVSLKWYRAVIDKFALKCLEKELHKTYNVPAKTQILDFERKTKDDPTVQTGLSMEQLKAQKAELADHQKQIKQAQADQAKAEDNKKATEQIAQQAYDALRNDYERVTGQKAVDSNNKPLSAQKLGEGLRLAAKSIKSADDKAKENQKIADQAVAALRASYKELTGKDAVDDHNQPLNPLECSRRIKRIVNKAKDDKKQADADKTAAQNDYDKVVQEQQAVEVARQNAQQQLNSINEEINDQKQKLKDRKQQRIEDAQKELQANNLSYNNDEPVTEENIDNVEQAIDEWRNNQRNDWQKDQQAHQDLVSENDKLQNNVNKNRKLIRRLNNLEQQAKKEGLTAGKIIHDRETLLGRINIIGKAYAVMEKTASLAVSFMKGKPWSLKNPDNANGKKESASERAYAAGISIMNYDNPYTTEEQKKKMENYPAILARKVGNWLETQFRRIYKKSPYVDEKKSQPKTINHNNQKENDNDQEY